MIARNNLFPADAVILNNAAQDSCVRGRHLILQLFAAPPTCRRAISEAAARIPELLHALDEDVSGDGPGRLCVLLPRWDDAMGRAAGALAETLVRYGAGHLVKRPVQVNLLRHPPTPEGLRRAAALVRALFSGRLDGVRGQIFDLRDLEDVSAWRAP